MYSMSHYVAVFVLIASPATSLVDKFSQHAMGRKWSSVLVRCQQPFKKEDQFGLSSLILSSSSEIPTNVCTPSPLPGPSATNSSKSSTTPRAVYNDGSPQMKKVNRKEDVLLLLSSPTSAGPTYKLHSSAMEKLMQERTQQQCTNSSLLAKRKEMRRVQLLKQSVPKSFTSSDYMETYAARPSKDKSLDFSPINRAVSLGLMLGMPYSSWLLYVECAMYLMVVLVCEVCYVPHGGACM